MKGVSPDAADMRLADHVDEASVLAGRIGPLEDDLLEQLAEHPLACITTEYPHYAFAMDGPDDLVPPSTMHPIFYGCFDWHSAVHSHWSLVRQLRVFDDHPMRESIIEAIDAGMTDANAEAEAAFFEDHPRFERPYGWGWLLRFVAELELWDEPLAASWRSTIVPLERTIRGLVEHEFLTMDRPLRVGTHGNAAFGLGCVIDYARVVDAPELEAAATEAALRWYMDDTDYPLAFEPFGWDFLSPGLQEAETMARVLDRAAFVDWFEGFLPAVAADGSLLEPVAVDPDEGDGMAMHLVGLDLSRAWNLASLATVLDEHPGADRLASSAHRHALTGLDGAFTTDYAGSHWLTSYALYLLTRGDGGIGPS